MTVDSPTQAAALLADRHIVGLAARPIDLLPLVRLARFSDLWSCEAADAEWTPDSVGRLFSLEGQAGLRERWRTPDIDRLIPVVRQLLATARRSRPSWLVPTALTTAWRSLVERCGADVELPATPPAAVTAMLSNKIETRAWLRSLGVTAPKSVSCSTFDLDYRQLASELGSVFVVQRPAGSGGIGTHLVTDGWALERIRAGEARRDDRWLASEFIADTTLNYHGFVSMNGDVTVMNPSVQLANIALVGSGFGEYCGSDFRAPYALPAPVLSRSAEAVARIGRELAVNGYAGVFGVDLSVGERVAVLEVNPRVQASTWLLGELELAVNRVPVLCRHVLERWALPTRAAGADLGCDAVQLVLRHDGPAGELIDAPRPGVYQYGLRGLTWVRAGAGTLDCVGDELVLSGTPNTGVRVKPGAGIARVVTRQSLTNPDGGDLTAHGRDIVSAVKSRFAFRTHDAAPLRAPDGGYVGVG